MTKEEFGVWAVSHGWTPDRWGHYHKGGYRLKVGGKSIRYEREYTIPANQYLPAQKKYLHVYSGFLSRLSITPEGKLSGMHK
jgi:hypothetical protein